MTLERGTADDGDRPAREGNTVRRPMTPNTPFVQGVLRHLEGAGVEWAPRPLGIDGNTEIVSWIAGDDGSDVTFDITAVVRMGSSPT